MLSKTNPSHLPHAPRKPDNRPETVQYFANAQVDNQNLDSRSWQDNLSSKAPSHHIDTYPCGKDSTQLKGKNRRREQNSPSSEWTAHAIPDKANEFNPTELTSGNPNCEGDNNATDSPDCTSAQRHLSVPVNRVDDPPVSAFTHTFKRLYSGKTKGIAELWRDEKDVHRHRFLEKRHDEGWRANIDAHREEVETYYAALRQRAADWNAFNKKHRGVFWGYDPGFPPIEMPEVLKRSHYRRHENPKW